MDQPDEAEAYDAMDHTEVNARFVADALAFHGPPRGGPWLDVGTGTAQIPIVLCRETPDQTFPIIAVDLADSMLKRATANIESAGFKHRIPLQKADAKALAAFQPGFEVVISNSIIHHIPEPNSCLAEMVRLVAPGGSLFVRDLARPPSQQALDQLVEQYAGGESDHAQTMLADSLHAALTVEELRRMVTARGLPASSVRMTSDRHWTLAWRRPVSNAPKPEAKEFSHGID